MQNHKHIIIRFSAITTIVCMGLLYANEIYAQAQAFTVVPLTTLPGLTTAGTAVNPTTYIQGLYAFAISIGVVIAVLSGVYAGIEYMLSESSFTTKEKAIKRIQNVGWGALLLLSSYLLLEIINPQLVQWNLSLGTINNSQLSGLVATDAAAQLTQLAADQQALATAATNNQTTAKNNAAALQTAQTTLSTLQANCAGADAEVDDAMCNENDPSSQISEANAAVAAAQAASTQANGNSEVSSAEINLNQTEQAFLKADGNCTEGTDCAAQVLAAQTQIQNVDSQLGSEIIQAQQLKETSVAQALTAEKSSFDTKNKDDNTLQNATDDANSSGIDYTAQN